MPATGHVWEAAPKAVPTSPEVPTGQCGQRPGSAFPDIFLAQGAPAL